ncbi:MAG TPA: mandelate racemase/muconate lactonizing enzyme family protein [Hyphomicrobiaceae bacterium]|nr:mandelate racemase/muconate lactonizing enzyme family protein [Hyphomicrobiaceae bacterium]
MKVTAIETIRSEEFPNILWVEVMTNEGIVGLGETFYGPDAAEGHIHGIIAPYLLGKDPRNIEAHQAFLTGYVGFVGSSAEMRGRSAIDIALWDILGQSVKLPLCDLLGGRVREKIRVYNTCAGYSYVQTKVTQGTANFGLDARKGQYEDLDAFLNRAGELAESLLEMGISAMKIWPFDYAAERSSGYDITAEELKSGLAPFEKIRKAVGDKMEIAAELHSLWSRPTAVKIARALEPIRCMWVEDPVFMDHLHSIGEVARATRSPIAVGETRGGRADFRGLLELEALSMVILDLSWCGGISEARKVATMAETYHVPVAFHDCTGPVVLAVSTHLALNSRNCWTQEMVRAFYYGWYHRFVTELPPVERGMITVPKGPGLGLALQPGVKTGKGMRIRRSDAKGM